MDYDLTRLGTREFEHLSQALAIRVLGKGVQVYGDGRDGRREATFRGEVDYPGPSNKWNGYIVLQAKFRQRPNVRTDAGWLIRQITEEMGRWVKARKEDPNLETPSHVIFTSNVVLSAVPGSGGIDSVQDAVKPLMQKLEVEDWAVWHHDSMCRYLDSYADIRRSFAGLTTPGDVLATLASYVGGNLEALTDAIASHTVKLMCGSQDLRLSQTGADTTAKVQLSEVAIDLPAHYEIDKGVSPVEIASYIIEQANKVRRRSAADEDLRDYVIVGGPGQGKTTIGQLICQLYRVALLADRPSHTLGYEGADVHRRLSEEFGSLDITPVASKRWPYQVSLSNYGDAISGGEDISLLRYIAKDISARSADSIDGGKIKSWLRSWPWLLVLDGLDEVPSPAIRASIERSISDFFVDVGEVDADLLVVITTRPQGYANKFSSRSFQHVHLAPLSPERAIAYAERLADAAYRGNLELHDQVVDRIKTAASDETTARLMQTPLQVTIMSLLFERRARAPKSRFSLFDLYYDAIYAREIGKPGYIARLLDEHRLYVDGLHEQVALELQVRAERDSGAESILPTDHLHSLAVTQLVEEGYTVSEATPLAEEIVSAATKRLVLLVPVRDGIGFEVRSLQELMAARAITRQLNNSVVDNLTKLARSAHWRNTWLLAVGRIFTDATPFRAEVISILDALDQGDPCAARILPGSTLAIDLLEDDIASNQPRYQRLLIERALGVLKRGPGGIIKRLANVLRPLVVASPDALDLVYRTTDSARENIGRTSLGALQLLAEWSEIESKLTASARLRLQQAISVLTPEQHTAARVLARSHSYRELRGLPEAEYELFDDFTTIALVTLVEMGGGLGKSEWSEGAKFIYDHMTERSDEDKLRPRIERLSENVPYPASLQVADALSELGARFPLLNWRSTEKAFTLASAMLERAPVGQTIARELE